MGERSQTKSVLWANVTALMKRVYGGENLSRLARETGIGPGSATRLKEQKTSTGLDTLEAIADRFEVDPWQLLTPNLGADLYRMNSEMQLVAVYRPSAEAAGSRERSQRREPELGDPSAHLDQLIEDPSPTHGKHEQAPVRSGPSRIVKRHG